MHLIIFYSQTSAIYVQPSCIWVLQSWIMVFLAITSFASLVRSLRYCSFLYSCSTQCLIQTRVMSSKSLSISSSITMLWRMIQASMTFWRSRWSYRRAGHFRILNRDCKIPKAHSTSFLAPSWHCANNLCFSDCGWGIDLTKIAHSGYIPSTR